MMEKEEKEESIVVRGGGESPDIVLVKEVIHGMEVWTADVRERGVKYNPNPYPPKTEEEKTK